MQKLKNKSHTHPCYRMKPDKRTRHMQITEVLGCSLPRSFLNSSLGNFSEIREKGLHWTWEHLGCDEHWVFIFAETFRSFVQNSLKPCVIFSFWEICYGCKKHYDRSDLKFFLSFQKNSINDRKTRWHTGEVTFCLCLSKVTLCLSWPFLNQFVFMRNNDKELHSWAIMQR